MKRKGFTLVELIMVIVVMATVAGLCVVNIDALSQKHRLRMAARELGGRIRYFRNQAKITGQNLHMVIDLRHGAYKVLTSAGSAGEGEKSVLERYRLPAGIKFEAFNVRSDRELDKSEVRIRFTTDGTLLEHAYVLANSQGQKISLLVNPVINNVSYLNGVTDFKEVE